MSPAAEILHIDNEVHIGNLHIPRASTINSRGLPGTLSMDRVNPIELVGIVEEVHNAGAIYFLSHEPVAYGDDPIDGIATAQIMPDIESAVIIVDFPKTTSLASRNFFVEATKRDVRENVLGINGNVTVLEATLEAKGIALEGLHRALSAAA